MLNVRLLIYLLIILLIPSLGIGGERNVDKNNPMICGYYPSWDQSLTPSQIQYKQFTHLVHAFVWSDSKGNLKSEGNLPSNELAILSHKNGVKVLLSVGGNGADHE